MKYTKLFSKGKIRAILKSKAESVMPAIGCSLATSTGEASDEIIRYYEKELRAAVVLLFQR